MSEPPLEDELGRLIKELYANGGAELLSIGLTVLVVNKLRDSLKLKHPVRYNHLTCRLGMS